MNSKSILSNKGLKITQARLAILDLLIKETQPLEAEEIWKRTNKQFDQATVYRVVKTLTEEGVINQVDLKQGFSYYEIKDDKNHHHHLVCLNCSKIVDIESCGALSIEKEILKKSGFKTVKEHSLEFFGLCNACG